MGAYAVDYITKAVNNTNYAGSTVGKTVQTTATTALSASSVSAGSSVVGNVFNIGGKIASRANVPLLVLSLLKGGYDNLTEYLEQSEKEALSDSSQQIVEQVQSLVKTADIQAQKAEALKEKVQTIDNSVVYEQGQSLPSVLSQNAKALTQSINALTTTMNEQLSLLNNHMMANAIYQQQFLDLKTVEADMKVESMQFSKSVQSVKDLDGQVVASFSPREAELVKNVTLAKDTTDKINFELPPELEADLASDNLDITPMFGYEDGEQIYKEFYRGMGGVGL